MSGPVISIVTPSLNQGATIETTIRSVADQGYPSFEHHVVDGGSTDSTLDVLRRQSGVEWTSEPDRGQTDAINRGLARARGEIVAYLNADDYYLPGAFAEVSRSFADPACQVLVGGCARVDTDGRDLGVYRARLDRPADLLRWWRWGLEVCIPQPAVFLRRSALDAAGPFDESFDMAMDLEMWMRLAGRFPFTLTERVLAAYRESPETKTSRRPADMPLECDRAARLHLDLASADDRPVLCRELDRQIAGHLLTLALDLGRPGLAWRAARFSPAVGASRRFWRAAFGRRTVTPAR